MRWILIFVLCPLAWGGTFTAATCNRSDVNAVINGPTHTAVDGDIILIPSGSCSWSSGVTVPSNIGITIQGNGTPNSTPGTTGASASCASNTKITVTSGATVFVMAPQYGNSTSRISCMDSLSGSGSGIFASVLGTCTSSGCPNLRMDNINYDSSWAGHTEVGISFGINATGDVFGVMDHNTINGVAGDTLELVELSNASYLGVGQWGDNSWHQSENYGSANFMYIENNTFNDSGTTENEGSAGAINNEGGGRIVARFNTYTTTSNANVPLAWHGTESSGRPRSTRAYEFYENTFSCNSLSSGCAPVVSVRGGTGLIWGNSLSSTSGSFSTGLLTMNTYRTQGTPSATWGPCDGSSPWDTDDGTTYYSGTVTSGGGTATITVSGSPGWTTNQWVSNGSPYSVHDVTQSSGSEITANTSNTITYADTGGPGQFTAANSDSIQILRATVCIDQAGGRGAGILYSGTTPSPSSAASEALSPTYMWLVSTSGPNSFPSGADTARVIQNREWYTENANQAAQTTSSSPFNGTTAIGMGHGTLANRPTTCTAGVAYWDTSEGGTWNNGAANSGALDICTSTNTWTQSYTPYTYPHPLTVSATPASYFNGLLRAN